MVSTCTFMTIGILSCRQRRNHTGCIFHQEKKIVIESTSTFFTYFPLFRHWPSKVARRTDVFVFFFFLLANFLGMATSHFFYTILWLIILQFAKMAKLISLIRHATEKKIKYGFRTYQQLRLWLSDIMIGKQSFYALTNIGFSLSKLSDITN